MPEEGLGESSTSSFHNDNRVPYGWTEPPSFRLLQMCDGTAYGGLALSVKNTRSKVPFAKSASRLMSSPPGSCAQR